MRIIKHAVIEKETGKRVYTNCQQSKCIEYLNALETKEKFAISHKWFSV
jgi:hypothetical protein